MANESYQSPWRKPPSRGGSSGQGFGRGRGGDSTYGGRGYNNRGSSRGSRPSRGSFSPHVPSPTLPPVKDYMDGLTDTSLRTVAVPELDPEQDEVTIRDCTYIGSYNWQESDDNKPTILVPGSPRYWQDRPLPFTVAADQGIFYADQNGYKMPKAVLLPLVVAVNKSSEMMDKEPFDWASVDIVTDRNNLRKLVRWVEGTTRDFRIDLQLAGEKTVLMTRFSERYQEAFNGRTFGFSFEKASTIPAPGCRGSTGHHRIISYDLNGLKMVVRFEVDACVGPTAVERSTRGQSSVDELADSLSAVSISETIFKSEYPLIVREGGAEVPFDSVIEMTTRSQYNISMGFNWQDAYPQLFFSKTANHYLAIHNRGNFERIEKRTPSTSELRKVEKDLQPEFKKTRKALDVIRGIVLDHGKEGRLSLICKDGVLKVYRRSTDESLLPSVVMDFFEAA